MSIIISIYWVTGSQELLHFATSVNTEKAFHYYIEVLFILINVLNPSGAEGKCRG